VPPPVLHHDLEPVLAETGAPEEVDQRLKRPAAATAAFSGADTHHNALRPPGHRARAVEQHTATDADRRTLEKKAAEHTGAAHDRVERAHGSIRRPAESGMTGAVQGRIAPKDERHQLIDHEGQISIRT
jgi:hypothetical protein